MPEAARSWWPAALAAAGLAIAAGTAFGQTVTAAPGRQAAAPMSCDLISPARVQRLGLPCAPGPMG